MVHQVLNPHQRRRPIVRDGYCLPVELRAHLARLAQQLLRSQQFPLQRVQRQHVVRRRVQEQQSVVGDHAPREGGPLLGDAAKEAAVEQREQRASALLADHAKQHM